MSDSCPVLVIIPVLKKIALYFGLSLCIYIYIYIYKVSKVGDLCQGRPEGSLFNSYYTEM